MEFSFKSNKRKYFVNLILFCLIMPIVFSSIIFLTSGNFLSSLWACIVTLGVMGVISTMPLLILYFNYKKYNKDVTFTILPNSKYIFKESSTYIEFNADDIQFIEFVLSYAVYDKRASFLLWDSYFYVKIRLKNDECFYITCITCDDLSLYFPKDIIKRKKRFFPFIG